jgi:hypothetical protein
MLRYIIFNIKKFPFLKKIGYSILNKMPNLKAYVQSKLIGAVALVNSHPVQYSHLSPQAQEIFNTLKTELSLKSRNQ